MNDIGKGSGKGAGNGADEVENIASGAGPVETAIIGGAFSKVGGKGMVLGDAGGMAGEQGVELAAQDADGGVADAGDDGGDGFIRADGDFLLVHEVAGIGFLDHDVEGDAGVVFAVDDGPVEGSAATVAGKIGAVHVKGAERGEVEEPRRNHIPVIHGQDEVGAELADAFIPNGVF